MRGSWGFFLRDSRMFFSLFMSNSHRHSSIGKKFLFYCWKKNYSLVITIIGAVLRKYFKDAITFTKYLYEIECVYEHPLSIMLWWVFQPMNDFYSCVSIHSHSHTVSIINWENILSWRTHSKNILAVNFLFSLSLTFPFTYK